jgi:hypothetical protein
MGPTLGFITRASSPFVNQNNLLWKKKRKKEKETKEITIAKSRD